MFAGLGARRVDLPTYPFQRRRDWSVSPVRGGDHPLLSGTTELASAGGFLGTGRLSAVAQPWLADHTVAGQVLVPGTALLELALRAADEVGCDVVRELTLGSPLVLAEHGEVKLQVWAGAPDDSGRRPLTVHRALLDACLHAGALAAPQPSGVPFTWAGVSLQARGVTTVRVRLAPAGPNDPYSTSIVIADTAGAPVASVESLVTRPLPTGGFGLAADRDALFEIDWVPVPAGEPGLASAGVPAPASAGEPRPVREVTARALGLVQQWLAMERFAGSRLVFLTSGAVSGADLAGAAVWGLVRSARSEHPQRRRPTRGRRGATGRC